MKKDIYVTRPSLPSLEEYIKEIEPLWESHKLTNSGKLHEKLKEMLKQYLRVGYISLMTNGHSALELALQSFSLKGEVITTPFTFASTTHAIIRNGLKPVFCDIKPYDFTIDETKIEALITEKTCAIVPVHVYGNVCNIDEIQKIADKYHLTVIYDAAHTFGAEWNGQSVSAYGDASVLSFHATKLFHTLEGGAVICHSQEMYEHLYSLKNFGIRSELGIDEIGANAKMDEFRAAMGICNLRHIEEEIQKRKVVYERYQENLTDIKGVTVPTCTGGISLKQNYAYYPILLENYEEREKMYNRLKQNNIYARRYFYPLITDFDCYREHFHSTETPIAKDAADRVLTLPLYSDLTLSEVDEICKHVANKRLKESCHV